MGSIACILLYLGDWQNREMVSSLSCLMNVVLQVDLLCGRGEQRIDGKEGVMSHCCIATSFASLLASSLPGMPWCPGIQ